MMLNKFNFGSAGMSFTVIQKAVLMTLQPSSPSVQTCNTTHSDFYFPLLPRWAAGHNVSLFFCCPLSHALSVTGRQAGRQSRFRWPGLAQDELRVTFCEDKWIKQCIMTSCLHCLCYGNFCLPACILLPKQHFLKKVKGAENVWGTVWIVCFLNNK